MLGETTPQITILCVEDLFSYSFHTVYLTGCLLFSGTFIKALLQIFIFTISYVRQQRKILVRYYLLDSPTSGLDCVGSNVALTL